MLAVMLTTRCEVHHHRRFANVVRHGQLTEKVARPDFPARSRLTAISSVGVDAAGFKRHAGLATREPP